RCMVMCLRVDRYSQGQPTGQRGAALEELPAASPFRTHRCLLRTHRSLLRKMRLRRNHVSVDESIRRLAKSGQWSFAGAWGFCSANRTLPQRQCAFAICTSWCAGRYILSQIARERGPSASGLWTAPRGDTDTWEDAHVVSNLN